MHYKCKTFKVDEMKQIAFVGQMMYFNCTIPRSMTGYKIHEVQVNFEPGDPSRFFPCLELNAKEKIDYWVFFRGEFVPREVIEALSGKKIWVSTEPVQREDIQRQYLSENRFFFLEHRKLFDFMTHYDCTEVPILNNNGFEIDCDFPLPVDTDTYKPLNLEKKWDLVFMGRATPRRQMLTGLLKKDFEFLSVDHGIYGEEAVRLYNMSKIGLNLNISNFKQNQHRVFNMMACGLPILSDEMTHTNWMHQEDEIYFKFVKEPDGRKLYSTVLDLLDDTSVPLKTRGQIMRRIAVKQFDARHNWARLIEHLEALK